MGWPSLLPPLLAILLAVWKRDVILALLAAILVGETLLAQLNPAVGFLQAIDRISGVFASADNVSILLFSMLVGALLALIRRSGGVSAFVRFLLGSGIATGPRSVSLLTTLLGICIFIESNLSILATGAFARSLFDRFGMSRARLAFVVDATCSPVSVLILLNGWGAYLLGLLDGYGLQNPVAVLLGSIPLNFYAISVLLLVFYTAASGRVHGAMARHEARVAAEQDLESGEPQGRIRYFLLPLLTLVGGIIGFMLYTGNGSVIAGDGARSVLYATVLAIAVAWLLLRGDRLVAHDELIRVSYAGMAELLPVVSILLLAFALGATMQALQTGEFIAAMVSDALPGWLIAPVVFLTACCISFTTGTSWGTFGILVPVVIPVALETGMPPSLLLAAVLSGGVFGDHCSPISDSTVLSSLASGCDHLLHVRTQLPYALLAGMTALILFALAGLQMHGT